MYREPLCPDLLTVTAGSDNGVMESNDKSATSNVVPTAVTADDAGLDPDAVDDEPIVELVSNRHERRSVDARQFLAAARVISDLAAAASLDVPLFRSPPRSAVLDRSITRRRHGTVVAVRRRGRPLEAIRADLIEGVVVANGLDPLSASAFRRSAWSALVLSGRPAVMESIVDARNPVVAGTSDHNEVRHRVEWKEEDLDRRSCPSESGETVRIVERLSAA